MLITDRLMSHTVSGAINRYVLVEDERNQRYDKLLRVVRRI